MFREGDRLLFGIKTRAAPLTEEGAVYFPGGTAAEVQRAERKAWTKGAHIAACDGGTFTAQIGMGGGAALEELKGAAVSRIHPPNVLHKAGTIGAGGATGASDAAGASLTGHSKETNQVLPERQRVGPTAKLKGACTTVGKARRKTAMGEAGIDKGEHADVPKHAG